MSTDVAIRERQTVQLSTDQLKFISGTEFVPPGLRGNLPAILACVATGRELGIGDMASLKLINVIDGKVSYSAELMVQLVRRAGHSIVGETSESVARVTGTRADNGDTMTVEWTLAMAEKAGLLTKQNWRKYPSAMLWARAVSQLCRMLFADCFDGGTYTPEELEVSPLDAPMVEPPADEPGESGPVSITAAQKKKANVLVGQLRDAENRLTTVDLYAAAGKNPHEYVDENGELHWSPLRDSLSKAEASVLIDRLEQFDKSGAEDVIGVPWAVRVASPPGPAGEQAEGLTLAEFKARRMELGLSAELVATAAYDLFAETVPSLTDEQRLQVFTEAVSRSQVPA